MLGPVVDEESSYTAVGVALNTKQPRQATSWPCV